MLPSEIECLQQNGYLVVPDFFNAEEIEALRDECNLLYNCSNALDPQFIIDSGCVVDVLANAPIDEQDSARFVQEKYTITRDDQIALLAKKFKTLNRKRKFDEMEIRGIDRRNEIISQVLFQKLPNMVQRIFSNSIQPNESDSDSAKPVYLFNEHYVVKPPESSMEFRWHKDDEEQLAMCLDSDRIKPYLSAWCALDDINEINGALIFSTKHGVPHETTEGVEVMDLHSTNQMLVNSGSVVFFYSDVWHCSSSNDSHKPRRVFYAQYSEDIIRARPNDQFPLSFAVPCSLDTICKREHKKKSI